MENKDLWQLSHPMRVRGLKSDFGGVGYQSVKVAPHAGAWIEIENQVTECPPTSVAPHAGAWIEIVVDAYDSGKTGVAPHAGAWIEMSKYFAGLNIEIKSHPMRVRGLK